MSVPIVTHVEGAGPQIAPIGFILSRVLARFRGTAGFESRGIRRPVRRTHRSPSLMAWKVWRRSCVPCRRRLSMCPKAKAMRSNQLIRARLRQLGRLGDYLSERRDALLGLGRAVDFACELTAGWADGQMQPRMAGLKQDVASLDDYEVHLSDKVQFLLDAMVGLIRIAQNDIFKILTIVSIVGIPPTLIAGIYSMNFKLMPEYNWMYGYPYGLALIALSAIAPLVWFKLRGWF